MGTGTMCRALVPVWLRVNLVSSLPSRQCQRVVSFDLRECERKDECWREVTIWLNESGTELTLDMMTSGKLLGVS